MRLFPRRKSARVAVALAAAIGSAAFAGVATGSPAAHADPVWGTSTTNFVAVGSNTIEDLFDAYSGIAPTPGDGTSTNFHAFAPLADNGTGSIAPSGNFTWAQVYSWDATNQNNAGQGDCISAKPGSTPIARPNGSGDGAKALSAAITGDPWSKATSSGSCAPQTPGGSIQITRDSALLTAASSTGGLGLVSCASSPVAGDCLAWVNIAHDAVSYAYYIKSGSGVTAAQADGLSHTVLASLFGSTSTGLFTTGGVTYMACLPQLGSGTEKFFLNSIGVTQANGEASATASTCVGFEENGANTFQTFANTAFGVAANSTAEVAVTPFSVGSWISQSNGFAFDRSLAAVTAANPVGLGTIDASTNGCSVPPYTGTPPTSTTSYGSETPDGCYEVAPASGALAGGTTSYGRELYVGISNSALNGSSFASNSVLRRIFGFAGNNFTTQGPTANATTDAGDICQAPYATTDLQDFGFLPAGYSGGTPVYAGDTDCGQETITGIVSPSSGAYTGS